MSGMIRRHRRCGCDCRDDGTYEQDPEVENPLAECEYCGAKAPCGYLVEFPCPVYCGETLIAATEFILRPECAFQNQCTYLGNGTETENPKCTWLDIQSETSEINPRPWSMTISDNPVVLTYSVGGNSIEYTAVSAWDCNGPNSLRITSERPTGDNCGPLPDMICIKPDLTSRPAGCVLEPGDSYDSEENRLACCDDVSCSGFTIRIYWETDYAFPGDPTAGHYDINTSLEGDTPQTSSSGPTTTGVSVNSPFGWTFKIVTYCFEGTWKIDVYASVPGVFPLVFNFVDTLSADSQGCCNLRFCCDKSSYTVDGHTLTFCISYSSDGSCDCPWGACSGHCEYVAVDSVGGDQSPLCTGCDAGRIANIKWTYSSNDCGVGCVNCITNNDELSEVAPNCSFYCAHGYPTVDGETLSVACAAP